MSRVLTVICTILAFAALTAVANDSANRKSRKETKVTITAVPWGPTQTDVDAAKARVDASFALKSRVAGSKYRLVSFEYLETEKKPGASEPPTRFRAVYYDYSNDRTFTAEGDFAGKESIVLRQAAFQPIASPEEFQAAVEVLRNDPQFASGLRDRRLVTFEPMPDVTVLAGTVERLINVGLEPRGSGEKNEIVSVSLRRGAVVRHESGAPPASTASEPESCGIVDSNQGSSPRGVAGQAVITVMDGQTTLWEMLVIRPSASSGTRASGVEVRDVKYRGKSVLKRGHVPVLNVEYNPQSCGPYRDWQWAEGHFDAPNIGAQNPAAGIRILASGQVARTSLETGNDTGNFQGVAVYFDHGETILVSELNASWYRYIMEWRFGNDGTIRPRFGFGAVSNDCVCNAHNHHVFWRLDFDIVQPNNKVFRIEQGRKNFVPLLTEMKQLKNIPTKRSLLVQNSAGNEGYMLVPNLFDGVVDVFGVSDMWILRYRAGGATPFQQEIDDGFNITTSPSSFIQIDQFVNGESLADQDVVVWYGAHFLHNDGLNRWNPSRSPEHLTGDHVVGPDLRPVRW